MMGCPISSNGLSSNDMAQTSKVLAIGSGKGGVGKSILSCLIARRLTEKGFRVGLVDADFGFPNLDVLLGLAPKTDLAAVAAEWVQISDAATVVDWVGSKSCFDLYSGRSGGAALINPSEHEVATLIGGISSLQAEYDYLVLDLPTGLNPLTLKTLSLATDVLFVSDDQPTAMTDTYACIKQYYANGGGSKVSLIINRIVAPQSGENTYNAIAKACRTFLGTEPYLAGFLYLDEQIASDVSEQQLARKREIGNSATSKSLARLVSSVLERDQGSSRIKEAKIRDYIDSKIEKTYTEFITDIRSNYKPN